MRRFLTLVTLAMLLVPAGALADHTPPHDTRPNPNCAWDSRRSVDTDGDGEPEHMVVGVTHNTTFPRQIVTTVWKPVTGEEQIPPFFGGHDGPDDVTVYTQGDHRMLGANPAHQENGEPEQLHNGAIYARVDYDEVENGRAPRADAGAGIYEADHLVMACTSTDSAPEDAQVAVCLAGMEFFRQADVECPTE